MRSQAFTVLRAGVAQAVLGTALWSAPVWAQDATDTAAEAEAGDIVVTGSRLPGAAEQTPVPVSSVPRDELLATAKVALGDALNDLPQLQTTTGQGQNSSAFGVTGLNLLDLRGLGLARTLVLVNGRRHVGADLLANGVSVDVNTIPTDLIERVDIVTGASSAVYGSDAVAGVVNFVLQNDFDGIRMGAQAGITDEGDAGQQRLTLTIGRNFADGRGNLTLAGEYSNQDPFYASQRENLRVATQLVQVDSDTAGTLYGSDGTPDRRFFTDVRSAQLSPGGLSNFATRQCGQDPQGAFYDCTFLFQPNGTLVAQTGTRVGLGPIGSVVGGNGFNSREGKLLGLISANERIGVNLLGHYDFADAASAFVEAKYFRGRALSVGSGPAFIQGTTLAPFGGDVRERPRLDNPYLTTQARTLLTAQLQAAAVLTPSPADDVITGATRFNLKANLVELGTRQEDSTRETYRIVGGLRGDLSPNLAYELSANYGEMRDETVIRNNFNTQRFLLAIDAAANSAGQIVCRSQISPAAAVPTPFGASTLAADVLACVPINLFGEGNISPAARNYINVDTRSSGKLTQFDALGFVKGDTGGFLNLPGGPIGFVVGGEYRREMQSLKQDPLVAAGQTLAPPIQSFAFPAFDVREAFAELRVPLLAGVPYVEALTLTAAGRLSDFGGGVSSARTYNLALEWTPVPALRLRGGYGRAFRVPNLSDLLQPQTSTTANAFADPCAARNATTALRAANCLADGAPAGYNPANTALSYRVGGNPDLDPETSNAWTLGGVFAPTLRSGTALRLSVDYYDIEVRNIVVSFPAQTIVNNCYDAPSLDNPFCAQFSRNRTGSDLATGETPFRIVQGSLLSSGINANRARVRGIDIDLSAAHEFGFGTLSTHFLWTQQFENRVYANRLQPTFANDLRGENGVPVDAFNWNLALETGPLQLGYQLRYLGPMAIQGNAIENVQPTQGRDPQDADYAEELFYPSAWYHNVRMGYDMSEAYNLYFGVDNLFDRLPPFDQTGVGGTTTGAANRIYDLRGRTFYAGVTTRF